MLPFIDPCFKIRAKTILLAYNSANYSVLSMNTLSKAALFNLSTPYLQRKLNYSLPFTIPKRRLQSVIRVSMSSLLLSIGSTAIEVSRYPILFFDLIAQFWIIVHPR